MIDWYTSLYILMVTWQTDAKEETQIRFVKKPRNLNMSAAFDESGEYLYTRKGRYNAAWNIAFDKESVAGGSFSFNGKQYKTFTAEPERTTAYC